ncbi:MAG: SBBP repeat-containing protein [Chloroflexota bacterium]
MPSLFIENQGQFTSSDATHIHMQGWSPNALFWLEPQSIQVQVISNHANDVQSVHHRTNNQPNLAQLATQLIELSFLNANPTPEIVPFDPAIPRINYFMGNSPAAWQTQVPTWKGVRYVDLYPGIDLEFHADYTEPRLIVHTTDSEIARTNILERIQMQVHTAHASQQGAAVSVSDEHQLVITSVDREMTLPLFALVNQNGDSLSSVTAKPKVKQTDSDASVIHTPYTLSQQEARTRPLAGEESLRYGVFLGSSSLDDAFGIDVDSEGNAVVVGRTLSNTFHRSLQGYDFAYNGGEDAFVIKLNEDGTDFTTATFLGGAGNDYAYGVKLDDEGNIYVAGRTNADGFPTTSGVFRSTFTGEDDIFVTKLNPNASELIYSTYLGGSKRDWVYALDIDTNGAVYLTGDTDSSDFHRFNAYDSILSGPTDLFVTKLAANGSSIMYSTFLGGFQSEVGYDIVVDDEGHAYVTGHTNSALFDTTDNAYQTSYRDGNLAFFGTPLGDAFVTKLGIFGNELVYSTFLGGSSYEGNFAGIALAQNDDETYEAIVTGMTGSRDFPVTENAYQQTHMGGSDIYITRLNATGSDLIYSTLIGGSDIDQGNRVVVDELGLVTVGGWTLSNDLPMLGTAYDAVSNGSLDGFLVRLDSSGSRLIDATYLGGVQVDILSAMALDEMGAVYATGWTDSPGFPTTQTSFNPIYGEQTDAFVVKVEMVAPQSEGTLPLSGQIISTQGQPIRDIDVAIQFANGTELIAQTDSDGFYFFENLPVGIYPIMPVSDNHLVSPPSQVVSLVAGEIAPLSNFIANEQTPVAPFLTLPLLTDQPLEEAIKDVSIGGRVQRWFDHDYPLGAPNGTLTLWSGRTVNRDQNHKTEVCYGQYCGDGFAAIGFSYVDPRPATEVADSLSVVAAAGGVVVDSSRSCSLNDGTCNDGFGNYVVIDHENGYFTRYARLNRVDMQTIGERISRGDSVGLMGYTGRPGGIYLYFSVHRDNGNGQWDGDGGDIDFAIDPFGWRGSELDKWAQGTQSAVSQWLWQTPQETTIVVEPTEATTIQSADVPASIEVVADTFANEIVLSLAQDVNLMRVNVGAQTVERRIVGTSFQLMPHFYQSSVTPNMQQPIRLSYDLGGIPPMSMMHVDENALSLYHWQPENREWVALDTDRINDTLMGTVSALGQFSVQAPLVCANTANRDINEPDDVYSTGVSIKVGNPVQSFIAPRRFDVAGDEDWFRLETEAGRIYTMQTLNLAPGVNTILDLYETDGFTLLESDDDGGTEFSSILVWEAPKTATYFIRIRSKADGIIGVVGCDADYDFMVQHDGFDVYLPAVER